MAVSLTVYLVSLIKDRHWNGLGWLIFCLQFFCTLLTEEIISLSPSSLFLIDFLAFSHISVCNYGSCWAFRTCRALPAACVHHISHFFSTKAQLWKACHGNCTAKIEKKKKTKAASLVAAANQIQKVKKENYIILIAVFSVVIYKLLAGCVCPHTARITHTPCCPRNVQYLNLTKSRSHHTWPYIDSCR